MYCINTHVGLPHSAYFKELSPQDKLAITETVLDKPSVYHYKMLNVVFKINYADLYRLYATFSANSNLRFCMEQFKVLSSLHHNIMCER